MLQDDIYTIIWSKRDRDGNPDWCIRTEIADTLGREFNVLLPADDCALMLLIREDKIKIRTGAHDDSKDRYQYKAIDSADLVE